MTMTGINRGWTGRIARRSIAIGVAGTGLALALMATGIGPIGVDPAVAKTCAKKCPKPGVQFATGKLITVEVVNNTVGLIKVEEVQGSDPIAVSPGRSLRLRRRVTTGADNASVLFWDSQGLNLRAIVQQPEPLLMRVELRPGGRVGDQSVYLKDDGRVSVF
jgi:hypothetical protein